MNVLISRPIPEYKPISMSSIIEHIDIMNQKNRHNKREVRRSRSHLSYTIDVDKENDLPIRSHSISILPSTSETISTSESEFETNLLENVDFEIAFKLKRSGYVKL